MEEGVDNLPKGMRDCDEVLGFEGTWRDPKVLKLHQGGTGLLTLCPSGRFLYYITGEVSPGDWSQPFDVHIGDYSFEHGDQN